MPKILTVELTPDQHAEVRRRLAAKVLPHQERVRLDCVRLLDRGFTVAQVADLLECHQVTVREAVHRWEGGGLEALADASRPGRPPRLDRADLDALGELLDQAAERGQTWTAAALCDWLAAERGVEISPAWLAEVLRRQGFRWKRTRDHLRHKADPVLQQAAEAQLEDLRTYGGARRRAPVI